MGKEILIIVLISFHFSAINDYFSTCIRVFSLPPPHTHTLTLSWFWCFFLLETQHDIPRYRRELHEVVGSRRFLHLYIRERDIYIEREVRSRRRCGKKRKLTTAHHTRSEGRNRTKHRDFCNILARSKNKSVAVSQFFTLVLFM